MFTSREFASQAIDLAPNLSTLEHTVNAIGALGGGILRAPGMALSGLGNLNEAMQRGVARPYVTYLEAVGADDMAKAVENAIDRSEAGGTILPWYLSGTNVLREPGRKLKQFAEVLEPEPEEANLVTDVFGGIGQVSAQIALALATGGVSSFTSLASLVGQGVDIQAEQIEASGADVTAGTDIALVGGGAVTAITERFGLNLLLNRIPAAVRSRIGRIFAGLTSEASQEMVEAVGQNLIALGIYNPDQDILEGVGREGTVAGIVGATVSAVIPGRSATIRRKEIMDKVNAASQSEFSEQSPEEAAEHRAALISNAGIVSVSIPVDKVLEFAEKHELGAAEAIRLLGVEGQMEEAIASGEDVVVTGDVFAKSILGTENYTVLGEHIRYELGGLTSDEASNPYEVTPEEMLDALSANEKIPNDLRTRTEEVLDDLLHSKVIDPIKLLNKIPVDVQQVLDRLEQDVIASATSFAEISRQGALTAIDEDVAVIDTEIGIAQNDLAQREANGRPTKAAQSKIDKLNNQKTELEKDRQSLLTQAEQLGPAASTVASSLKGGPTPTVAPTKRVSVRAKALKDLNVKTTNQSIQALRKGFKKAGSILSSVNVRSSVSPKKPKIPLELL